MAKQTNEQVINAFFNQEPARAGALTTDGTNLYSYNLVIAKWFGGQAFVFDYTSTGGAYYSQTTSSHVGRAKRAINNPDNIMLVEVAKELKFI